MSIFATPIAAMTRADWSRASTDYGLRTEHAGAHEPEIYGGFGGKPRGCDCGCTPESDLDLFDRYEAGTVGEVT